MMSRGHHTSGLRSMCGVRVNIGIGIGIATDGL